MDLVFDQASTEVVRDALSQLRQDVSPTEEELNAGEAGIAAKARCHYEAARLEVLSWPGWDFAAERDCVRATRGADGSYAVPAPMGAVAIRTCLTRSRRPVSWRLAGDMIYSDFPISYIDYVRNEKDIGRWSPMARKALVYCLARDLAIPVCGRRADHETMTAMCEEIKSEARLADARNSRPNRSAYGNRLSEIVTGNVPEFGM